MQELRQIRGFAKLPRSTAGEAAEEGLDVATETDRSTKSRQVTMREKTGPRHLVVKGRFCGPSLDKDCPQE